MIDIIEKNRKYLNDKDIELLEMLNEGITFIEVARRRELTRERVRQIARRAFKRLSMDFGNIEEKLVELRKFEHELFIREKNIIRKEKELDLNPNEEIPYHSDFYLSLDVFANRIKMPIRLFNTLSSLNVLLSIDSNGLPVYGENVINMAQVVDSLRIDGDFVSKTRNAGRKTMEDLRDILLHYGIEIEVNWGRTAVFAPFPLKANKYNRMYQVKRG